MPGFVGIKQAVSTEELQALLEWLEKPESYFRDRDTATVHFIALTVIERSPDDDRHMG